MRFRIHAAVVAATALVATACADQPTGPASSLNTLTSDALLANGQHGSHVIMQDACDPTTFNALFGDGTCVRTAA